MNFQDRTQRVKVLPALILAMTVLPGCAHLPHTHGNHRPMIKYSPASAMIADCTYAVKFNEDEATVKESNYLGAISCMSYMSGIIAANKAIRLQHPEDALFCIPKPGLKNWLAAKVIVDFAKAHPELLGMNQPDFALIAMHDAYPCNEP